MSLGVRYNLGTVDVGDTAELYVAVQREGVPLTQEEIASVAFTVQKPDQHVVGPLEGTVEEDGRGYYQWTDTAEVGEYMASARFTLTNGEKTSIEVNFAVNNPFDVTPLSMQEIVIDDVWFRLEDAFDSIEGGPWLRDETRGHFDRNKIGRYIPETLLDINVQMPLSDVTIDEFAKPHEDGTPNPLLPLLSKGVLCRVIMHLIRSYIEQPRPQGAQVVWDDRTSYSAAWKEVYESEHSDYYTMVRLWKRGMLNLGHSALLVSSKAGRLYYGTQMRLRNVAPRGYY